MGWFTKFIRDFIPDRRICFHSFRHNFDTILSNNETNVFLIQCLARPGELGSRYSKGDITKMKTTLEKVVYDFDVIQCLRLRTFTDEEIAAQTADFRRIMSKLAPAK